MNCWSRHLYLLFFLTSAAPAFPMGALDTASQDTLAPTPGSQGYSVGHLPTVPASVWWLQNRRNSSWLQGPLYDVIDGLVTWNLSRFYTFWHIICFSFWAFTVNGIHNITSFVLTRNIYNEFIFLKCSPEQRRGYFMLRDMCIWLNMGSVGGTVARQLTTSKE